MYVWRSLLIRDQEIKMSVIDNSINESTDTSDISIDIQSTDDGNLPPINSDEVQKRPPRRPDIDIIR